MRNVAIHIGKLFICKFNSLNANVLLNSVLRGFYNL